MIDYFQQPIEEYFYINIIPDIKVFNVSDHFYFYILIFLCIVPILIFTSRIIKKRTRKVFMYFLLIFWLLTCIRWFVIQARWIQNDLNDFYGKTVFERQNKGVSRVIKNYGLPENWHDFYDFLMFGKNQASVGSAVYFVPDDPVFHNLAQYYLYPEVHLTDSSETADYIFSFNVDLPDAHIDIETLKQLGLNKIILKQK